MQKEPFANELIIDELQHINVLVCLRYVLQIRVEITTENITRFLLYTALPNSATVHNYLPPQPPPTWELLRLLGKNENMVSYTVIFNQN